jgi:predicted transcriptional regulator
VETLRSTLEPSKKTTIMYRSSLTLPQLREYLTLLVEKGLLEFIRETKSYKTTPRGRHVMGLFEHMEMFVSLRAPTTHQRPPEIEYYTPRILMSMLHYLFAESFSDFHSIYIATVPLFSLASDNKNT